MSDPSNIPWSRILVEGVAIIASILIAFAIDAWWEDRQETEAEIRNLTRVSAELAANSERIQRKLQTLESSIQATSTFISWMGPEPAFVEREVLVEQWDSLYAIGFFSLQRNAANDYLASGQTEAAKNSDVRRAVSEWYSSGTALEEQYERLRAAHENISIYLQDTIPFLNTISANALMTDHPSSKFPFDQAAFLADSRLESRMALFLIRMEFVVEQAEYLQKEQEDLEFLIEATVRNSD